jgi:uncharacterized repeat protein (TIGR03803 family)
MYRKLFNQSRQRQSVKCLLTIFAGSAMLMGFGGQIAQAQAAQAQVLFAFTATNGTSPFAKFCAGPDGNFYGTTTDGGTNGDYGTVIEATTNGQSILLASFANTNGADPQSGLTAGADGNFYGTTVGGGTNNGYGTVFRVTTNGLLTSLTSFANTNGAYPYGGLTLGSDGSFYGTTYLGGSNSLGTVFKITTNGVLTSLASFAFTNGANPHTGLTLGTDGNLYGTTTSGGTNGGYGTIFKVTTNGSLISLASFANTNGAYPQSLLAVGNDGDFYGTTYFGGNDSVGSVFRVDTNGTLTLLLSFDQTNGANPVAELTLASDGNFYGTTSAGGSSNLGTVFQLTTNGALTTLVSFAGTNGANPHAGLISGVDGNFYGTTANGGGASNGVAFKIIVAPTLSPVFFSNQVLQGNVQGLARPLLQIQTAASVNASWSVLTNLVFTNGIAQFIDPSAANGPQRFYRAMVQ